jgi:hypothetical protein
MLRDVDRTAPPAPAALGFPALANVGNTAPQPAVQFSFVHQVFHE